MKKFFYTILVFLGVLAALVGRIDRSPIEERTFYKEMMNELDTLQVEKHPATDTLRAGWSRFSIVPDHTMPMAGYSPRDSFHQVHDTLYARVLSLNNGSRQVFMISMDLLIVPPVIKKNIMERLRSAHKDDFVYFSATHTHNGVGGWENSIGGKFAVGGYSVVGGYDEAWVNQVTDNLMTHLELARTSMVTSTFTYLQSDADEYVWNRLAGDQGTKDGKIRGLKFVRADGKKALLFTYAAHATSISSSSRSLSGDYPAAVVHELQHQGWDFPLFMGGMVGSHTLGNVEGSNFDLTEKTGVILAGKILHSTDDKLSNFIEIDSKHVKVQTGPSQLRLLDNWKLRDWVFRLLLGRLEADVTYLKLGDVLLLGMPCDFSGELAVNYKFDSLASGKNEHLIITSFNGNYTGYITEDKHYDTFSGKEEVRTMNWVGPYYGRYYTAIVKKLIDE